MCAIFGFSGEPKHKAISRLVEELFYSAMALGKDATGWMRFKDGKFEYHKAPINALTYLYKYGLPEWGNNLVVHTRFATSGDPAFNRNNHPFIGKKYGMVHNGYLYPFSLNYYSHWLNKSECDSEIFLNMAEAIGFKQMYKTLARVGVFSLVFMNKETGTIYIMKNPAQRIYFVDLRDTFGVLLWVSRKHVFDNAVKNGFKLFPNYTFEPLKNGVIYKIKDGEIKKKNKY